ncbi:thiol-disulfide isomerase/thioredoxin [Pedobacter nutrimenti]|uniref:Thiol-disulfide isomerase/thioredoxin n=2 Tax=Pedobacter nutrimenti TaxID=1241337 RepID=A0A318UFB2_9SPHI|nr:thiol-disulfide isomerase/thioredoxin [Pedobacter nutrimenti]
MVLGSFEQIKLNIMKRHSTILVLLLLLSASSFCKEKNEAEKILQKTSETLNRLKVISYSSYREINNFADNYFAKNSGDSYFEYNNSNVARFQMRSTDYLQVYNGNEYFLLDHKDKTIELEKKTIQQIKGLSLLYNSIAALRIALPLILAENSPKSIKDTLIEGKTYHLVRFELHKKSIEFPEGISTFDAEVTKYYKLVIDQHTALPYMLFDSNSINKDQYYTKTIFTKINTKPAAPEKKTWNSFNYKSYKPYKKPLRNPVAAVGATFPKWSLPKFDLKQQDTLKSTDVQDKIVLMEFWIKDCGYCMEAFSGLKDLQQKYGKNIEILSINAHEKKEDVGFFYKREKPGYTMLYNGEKLAGKLGIYGYPHVIILNKTGTVIYSSEFDKEKIEGVISKVL